MFCNKCGSKIDDDAVFCESCGNPVGQASSPTQTTTTKSIPRINLDFSRAASELIFAIKNPIQALKGSMVFTDAHNNTILALGILAITSLVLAIGLIFISVIGTSSLLGMRSFGYIIKSLGFKLLIPFIFLCITFFVSYAIFLFSLVFGLHKAMNSFFHIDVSKEHATKILVILSAFNFLSIALGLLAICLHVYLFLIVIFMYSFSVTGILYIGFSTEDASGAVFYSIPVFYILSGIVSGVVASLLLKFIMALAVGSRF